MNSEETTQLNQSNPPQDVQRDSETPLPQKPSFLFTVSILIGVLTIIVVSASAYHGYFN